MITRRDFLKIGAAVFAGTAASKVATDTFDSPLYADSVKDLKPDKKVPTFCEICFWKCGMLASVKNGKIIKVEGNPDHPLSNGRLCPRGTSARGIIYDKDRLQTPLIRTKSASGKQKFEVVSWDKALDEAAGRLQQIMEKHGADKIALFSHGHGGSFFKTLLKGMGSKNVTAPSYAQCRGPRQEGFGLTFGRDVGSPEGLDLPYTRCVVMIGSHLGENMHNTQVQELSKAIDNGASFITVDPRYSTMAGKSDYWLPIKPGTDIALLLAWINVMITEGIYQKEFIANNASGFDKLAAHVKDKTPEWAYLHTSIEPDLIRKTARFIAKNAPASIIHPGRHVVWYGDDTQRSRAIAILNALLGNWGKRGGIYMPSGMGVKEDALPDFPEQKKFKLKPKQIFPFASAVPAQCYVNSAIAGEHEIQEGEQMRAWLVYGCNLPTTLPDPRQVRKALQALDFVLTIDILPAEITAYSDIVLPEATFLERYDDYDDKPFRTPYIAIRQPVVEPLYQSKPGWWIAKNLAKRIKVNGESLEKYFPHKDMKEKLEKEAKINNFSFVEIEKKGAITRKVEIYDNSPTMKFSTKSGKIELYSQALTDAGFAGLPEYIPQEEPPEGYFRLLFGRHPVHTFSRTSNNSVSLEIFPENELWLNTEIARILGIKHGSYVVLQNQDGVKSGRIKVKVTQRIRQDCVYMVHGFGNKSEKLTKAFNRGASDSDMVTRYKEDPIMGGTGMNVNFVSLIKA